MRQARAGGGFFSRKPRCKAPENTTALLLSSSFKGFREGYYKGCYGGNHKAYYQGLMYGYHKAGVGFRASKCKRVSYRASLALCRQWFSLPGTCKVGHWEVGTVL